MKDQDALELCKKFGNSMSKAGVLDTLDGGWLIIGTVPKEPIDKLAKWQFNPDQPRDDWGRWTAGGGDVEEDNDSPTATATDNDSSITGQFTTTEADQAKAPVDFQKFFDTYLPYVDPMADQLDTDPDFFLALIAKEDTWGTDEHNRLLNNYFGVTYAGKDNQGYDSPEQARQYWINTFGANVKGATDIDDFIAGLKKDSYNTEDKNYYPDLKDAYYSVLRHRLRLGIAQWND